MTFFFHPDAAVEFDSAVEYYEQFQEGLGFEFSEEVYATISPKFLRYQESKLLISKLFSGKTGFIYMATAQEAEKPVPEAEISLLIDKM